MQNDLQKKILLWGGVTLLVLAIMYGASALVTTTNSDEPRGAALSQEPTADDWVKGNPNAPITIVEYSDFECPFCMQIAPELSKLIEQNGDSLRVIYRHFPLTNAHDYAEAAAYATEAAGLQGKFWEMHDKIFSAQSEWERNEEAPSLFEGYAEEIGLDMEQYKVDVSSADVKKAVREDSNSALRSGVNSTPSLFLNGFKVRVSSPQNTVAELQPLIDELLAAPHEEAEATESADYQEPEGAQDER